MIQRCLSKGRLGGLQIRSVRFGEEKNFVTLPGIEKRFLGCPASSLVITLTTLTWLPCSYVAVLVDPNIHYNTLSITIITVTGCTRDFLDSSELLDLLKPSGFFAFHQV